MLKVTLFLINENLGRRYLQKNSFIGTRLLNLLLPELMRDDSNLLEETFIILAACRPNLHFYFSRAFTLTNLYDTISFLKEIVNKEY